MTNIVATTALKAIANEPEAALSGAVAQTVEASSGWLDAFTAWVDKIDGYVWGVPLIGAILVTGLLLTCVLRLRHLFNLGNAFRYMFHTEEGTQGDNPPVGLLLCTQKGKKMVEYAKAGMDNKLFVSTYQLQLPDERTLEQFLKHELEEI